MDILLTSVHLSYLRINHELKAKKKKLKISIVVPTGFNLNTREMKVARQPDELGREPYTGIYTYIYM